MGSPITGVTSGPPLNQFPVLVDPSSCGLETNPRLRCFQYQYTIHYPPSLPLYYSLFSVSATQLVPLTSPVASLIQPAYTGDDDFLDDALHEYVLKFSGSTSTNVSLFVRTGPGESSNARVGTVMVKAGYKREGCLIATPGVTSGNAFQPIQHVPAGHGCRRQVLCNLVVRCQWQRFRRNRCDPDTAVCRPLQRSRIPTWTDCERRAASEQQRSLWHHDWHGTKTCYGPPRPSIPKCVCSDTDLLAAPPRRLVADR